MKALNNKTTNHLSPGASAYTLRSKVWLMVILLAIVNCVLGAGVFVAVSFITFHPWMPMVLSVGVTTAATVAFATWMSGDILEPLYKLYLLAKSIERTPGISVPHTTGAAETDDILQTIGRASKQLTNFVDLMDEVTAGNTKVVLDPLEHSDRLSESFQRLVAKVTDSIDAKAELNDLQRAVDHIAGEVAGLHRGEPIRVANTFERTRSITDALRHLLERQNDILHTVGPSAAELRSLLAEEKNRLAIAVERDDVRMRSLKKLQTAVDQMNLQFERAAGEIAGGLAPAVDLFEELKNEAASPDGTADSQTEIRRQFDAAFHKMRDVSEQSLAITHVARTVQDLSKRSNLIALNTSVPRRDGQNVSEALTQEITSLSERAEKASKAITGISDAIVRDIKEATSSLRWVYAEVGKLGARADEAERSVDRAFGVLSGLAELRNKVGLETVEQKSKAGRSLQLTEELTSQCEEVSTALRSCESGLVMFNEPLDTVSRSARMGTVKSEVVPGTNSPVDKVGSNIANIASDAVLSNGKVSLAHDR